jgi:hypothetical protein
MRIVHFLHMPVLPLADARTVRSAVPAERSGNEV